MLEVLTFVAGVMVMVGLIGGELSMTIEDCVELPESVPSFGVIISVHNWFFCVAVCGSVPET